MLTYCAVAQNTLPRISALAVSSAAHSNHQAMLKSSTAPTRALAWRPRFRRTYIAAMNALTAPMNDGMRYGVHCKVTGYLRRL